MLELDVPVYSMMDVAPTVSAVLDVPAPAGAKGRPILEIVADLQGHQRLALLAPDAFGWFAWSLWQHEMPFLREMHAQRSIALRSVLPSITPVNFATMVTGTDVDGHQVHTYRHDFACETLFDVLRRAGEQSAAVGFVGYTGSELLARYADIDGTVPPGEDDSIAERVLEIAQRQTPVFLIAQLGRVDDVFHAHGPSSPEVVPMVQATDTRLRTMVEGLKVRDYGVIILADHGQHDIEGADTAMKGGHGSDRDEDCLVPCTWR